jgi:hypothetical protein
MLTINHPYTATEVVNALCKANPSKKQTVAASLRKWEQYQNQLSQAIQKSLMLARDDQIDDQWLPIEWEKLNLSLGECRRFNYLTWFHKNFPLVNIVRIGTPGTLTMIEPLYNIEIAAISQTPKDAFVQMYEKYFTTLLEWEDSEYSTDVADWVPIDTRSLQAFIDANLAATKTAKRSNHIDALKVNLVWARTILLCAEYFEEANGSAGIPQIVKESEFGRRYYQGLNLQNCPRVVRHAALGDSVAYDLNASVFAWRYSRAKQINPELKLSYTREYLDEKDVRRKMLAQELEVNVGFDNKIKIIKQLMTAIGFGVRASNGGVSWTDSSGARHYPSINSIIKSPKAREKLLNHPWLKAFVEEQNTISKTIFNEYKESLAEVECVRNERGNISANKSLAYLYQHDERAIINQLRATAEQHGSFLLVVHDGIYTSHNLKLVELREMVNAFNPEATLSKEEFRAWGFNADEQTHKNLIRQLELDAHDGIMPKAILANYVKIEHLFDHREYAAYDEYDNGNRLVTEYDPELDPFLD